VTCSSRDHTSARRWTRSTPTGREKGSGNPLLSLAMATGKSLLIGWLVRDAIEKYPDVRILCLVHVQELIEQNVKHLHALWPDAPLGINCAALGRRDWHQQIIFASIQSVFRSPARPTPPRPDR
jgi:DNA repair protein RadD